MKIIYTLALLVLSNIFMTFAWYGHLKFKEWNIFTNASLLTLIILSWGLAFFEYCFQVPANKIGFQEHGGPFTLLQLKLLQEVISLTVFVVIVKLLFKSESFTLNHLWGFICLLGAVYFFFKK